MLTIDCLGDFCPVPAIKLTDALGIDGVSEVLLITDHSCVSSSVGEICHKRGLLLEVTEPIAGVWELRVKKPQPPNKMCAGQSGQSNG